MDKIRISAISYLNTFPFVYGIQHSKYLTENCVLDFDFPAVSAERVLTGKADIGIIPVAALAKLDSYEIVSPYCIGAVGKVASVSLLSDVPLKKIKKIVLDYQSRTSVALARILAEKYWKIKPDFVAGSPGFEQKIGGYTAGVVIGDRALLLKKRFTHDFDLSDEWLQFTGLPFVFAVWASLKPLDSKFTSAFTKALSYGLSHIETMVLNSKEEFILPPEDVLQYLKVNISYDFTSEKQKGMKKFLSYLNDLS